MPFSLKEEWAYAKLRVGDYVQATLVVAGDRAWLEEVAFARGNATEMLDMFDRRTLPDLVNSCVTRREQRHLAC